MSKQIPRKVIGDVRDYVADQAMPTRRQYLSALAAAAATGAAGCAGGGDDSESTDQTTTSTDSGSEATTQSNGGEDSGSGDSDTFIVGDLAGLENLDPTMVSAVVSFHVLENTQERLFNIRPDLKIETELATDLEVSNGGKTWTMPIREGVMFHEPYKRELVAEDFIKTFEWIADSDNGSSYAYYFANVEEMVAQDDYTLQFELSKPVVDMKVYLAKQGSGVWPMEAREEMGDLKNHPVGTGPFVFDEWVPESHTRVVKNPDYWEDGKPHFETVEFRPIPKKEVRLTELQTGEVEFMEPDPQDIETVKNDDNLVYSEVPTPSFNEIKVQTGTVWRDDNPLADANGGKKARQAIVEAIDYPSMQQAASQGIATPTQNPFPKNSPWHVDYNPYSFEPNPERAKQLLDEAGVGTDITITIRTNNAYASHQALAKVIQANLRQVGIEAKLELSDWATELQYEGDGHFDLAVNGWPAFISPDAYLYSIFHTDGGFNSQGFSNEALDSLLEQGKSEFDTEKRQQIYADAQKIIVDECPYIWLLHWPHQEAYHKNISGRENHPYNYLGWNWKDVKEA